MVTQQKLKAVGEPQNQVNAVADRGTRALAVRLAEEFIVIVTGVLVALGVATAAKYAIPSDGEAF